MKTDIEVNPTSLTSIMRIKDEYIRYESEQMRRAPMDTTPISDLLIMDVDTTLPTPVDKPTCIPSFSTLTTSTYFIVSHPPLAKPMLYKIGT